MVDSGSVYLVIATNNNQPSEFYIKKSSLDLELWCFQGPV